jgi:streptogramin lyase
LFVTGGPDGNLWFSNSSGSAIGRLRPDGTVQSFPIPSGASPFGITAGPDGNIWFTDAKGIGRVTLDGNMTEFSLPTNEQAVYLTSGPDGNIWFSAATVTGAPVYSIGRMTVNGQVSLFTVPGQTYSPNDLTAGPDGNIWFSTASFDQNGHPVAGQLGRITPAGVVTLFSGPTGGPYRVARGPDGDIWFTEEYQHMVGKITIDGTVTEYTVPVANALPNGLAAGPDGNIWFTLSGAGKVDDIAPNGTFGTPVTVADGGDPHQMATGPGGFPWFSQGNQVGEVVIPGMPFHGHIMATGADQGGSPEVRVYDAYSHVQLRVFDAYDRRFPGGVRVAVGDVNHDGIPDIITAPGPGGGPDVRVFDGATGNIIMEFMAYDYRFPGGVYVAAGDVNHDGYADIITGAGLGGGPNVTVFSGKDGSVLYNFMAYDYRFTGGVRVAAGDVNNDGYADIITSPGPNSGPHVEAWSGKDRSLLQSFMAYPLRYSNGVFVTAGDVNGDGKADIIVSEMGPGQGFPQVRVFRSDGVVLDYNPFTTMGVNGSTGQALAENGIHVGFLSDTEGDGGGEILVSQSSYGAPTANVLDPADGKVLDAFFAYDPRFLGGLFIGGA